MSVIDRGIFQDWPVVPFRAEAVTPSVMGVTSVLCTMRKAVVYMLTVNPDAGWFKFANKVTGPPVEGLGNTTGVELATGVEVMVTVGLEVEVKVAVETTVQVNVGVEEAVGVEVGVELGVKVGVFVGVAVAGVTVTAAPKTGMPLNETGWPLLPLAPVTLKL